MKMTNIKNKKQFLAFIKKKKNFKNAIQQHRTKNLSKLFKFNVNTF